MYSPHDSLKAFANRIAKTANSTKAIQLIRLLRTAGFFGDHSNTPATTSVGTSVSDLDDAFGGATEESYYGQHVGIWERQVANEKVTLVRRRDAMPEWTKRIVDAEIARTSRNVVNEILTAYESKSIPVVWMIPEFNLRDWHDPITNAPYLPNGLNKTWLELHQEARQALQDKDYEKAALLAQRMIEIDEGICTAGLYILAECKRHAKDVEAERKYLTLARDATSWDVSQETIPRPYAVMQNAVREETSKHNVQVIDLPELFKEYLKGEIADRRLFLDYCHLTTEGIRVAMGAAASCVLRALKGVNRSWLWLVDNRVAPSPEMKAEALFLAMITNTHGLQPYELAHHFCTEGLNHSRHVGELMLNYIELQMGRVIPPRMSETEERMWRAESPLMRNLLRLNRKRLDCLLLKVVVDTFEEFGLDARERVEQLLQEEHSVTGGPTDLLDYYYCSAVDQPQELVWTHRCESFRSPAEYYRAYWPESRFIFIGEAGCAVHLCLTCRLPQRTPREATITVKLNAKPQVGIIVDSNWSTWDIDIPGAGVQQGVNEILICWPMPEFDTSKALETARLKVIERQFPDFYPVFGEIHSFTASDGRKVRTNSSVVQVWSSVVQAA